MINLQKQASQARLKVLELIYKAQTSHIGSNFSCIDILTAIFEKFDFEKDKIILSAGWKAASLYYFLWKADRITEEELNSYCQEGSKFIGLAEPIISDIPFAGGSMGFGLPGAVGFALAKKMKKEDGRIFVLMSDGELQIGTTWEASLIAARYNLGNLIVFVDRNGYQAMGPTHDILPGYFPAKDWNYETLNGHDIETIQEMIEVSEQSMKPVVVVCNTIKGKGVSFMENNNLYHYKQLSAEEYNAAVTELTWEK